MAVRGEAQRELGDRVSDHLPLGVELVIDRSSEAIARTLGVDLGAPDPFAGIPDWRA